MTRFITAILVVLLLLPGSVLGSGKGEDGHGHSPEPNQDNLVRIVAEALEGVQAFIEVEDVRNKVKGTGDPTTHLIRASFVRKQDGSDVTGGGGALRFTEEHDKIGYFEAMQLIDGKFRASVRLSKTGEQHFLLGTLLEDGVKRNFHFHFVMK